VTSTHTALVPLTLEDAGALTALLARVDAAEQREEPATEATIREWLATPGLDLATDSLAVREGERLLAFSIVDVSTSRDRDGRIRCQLTGTVDPEHRGQGIGSALLARAEEQAAHLASVRHPGAPAVFRVSGGRDPSAAVADQPRWGGADVRPLLDRRGYRRARSWLCMTRDLPGPALAPAAVTDAQLLSPSPAHSEPARLAHVAAFADHWGSAPITPERWRAWTTSSTSRPALSTLAVAPDGTVLAYALADEDKPGVLHIALVGTRPEARGRGLGRAVLTRTLRLGAEQGFRAAELEVDAESLTGATRLYDALGFTRAHVAATYEKPVDAVGEAR
jgi:mycothiol synthase